ncbi:MAG: hypothetical protein HC771_13145 [Synechococcales cyanobacterium CRU_2_2]|nr:hypothetical protein [Synechococcales cyanobacterium CRU_2_2]
MYYQDEQMWHQPEQYSRYPVDPFWGAIAQTFAFENQLYYQEQQLWAQQNAAMRDREMQTNRAMMQEQIAGDEELRELSGEGYEALMAIDRRCAQAQSLAIKAAVWGGNIGF